MNIFYYAPKSRKCRIKRVNKVVSAPAFPVCFWVSGGT